MPKQSEYMEAFFGVELNTKFEDMISELKDAEENLKELSTEIGTLTQNLNPEEFRELIKECRAVSYENAQQIKDVRTFLDFYLKSDKTSTHIILERDAYMKIYQIFKWDGADVRDLKRWIKEAQGDLRKNRSQSPRPDQFQEAHCPAGTERTREVPGVCPRQAGLLPHRPGI